MTLVVMLSLRWLRVDAVLPPLAHKTRYVLWFRKLALVHEGKRTCDEKVPLAGRLCMFGARLGGHQVMSVQAQPAGRVLLGDAQPYGQRREAEGNSQVSGLW